MEEVPEVWDQAPDVKEDTVEHEKSSESALIAETDPLDWVSRLDEKADSGRIVLGPHMTTARHEKRLRDRILLSIAARGGEEWPVEKRMLASIERSAKKSGVDLDRIDPPKNWGGKNLFEKARDVGLDDACLGAFAGPSHSVHGNWQDLLEYHLKGEDGGFLPDFEWHPPRPQLLTTVAYLTLATLDEFFSHIIGPAGSAVAEKFPDLRERIQHLVQLHEEFLAAREGAAANRP